MIQFAHSSQKSNWIFSPQEFNDKLSKVHAFSLSSTINEKETLLENSTLKQKTQSWNTPLSQKSHQPETEISPSIPKLFDSPTRGPTSQELSDYCTPGSELWSIDDLKQHMTINMIHIYHFCFELGFNQKTVIAETAIHYYLRWMLTKGPFQYDSTDIWLTAIYLSTKLESRGMRVTDFAGHAVSKSSWISFLQLDIISIEQSILLIEPKILAALNFDLHVFHPYQTLRYFWTLLPDVSKTEQTQCHFWSRMFLIYPGLVFTSSPTQQALLSLFCQFDSGHLKLYFPKIVSHLSIPQQKSLYSWGISTAKDFKKYFHIYKPFLDAPSFEEKKKYYIQNTSHFELRNKLRHPETNFRAPLYSVIHSTPTINNYSKYSHNNSFLLLSSSKSSLHSSSETTPSVFSSSELSDTSLLDDEEETQSTNSSHSSMFSSPPRRTNFST